MECKMPPLKAANICYRYNGQFSLDNISLTVEAGKFFGIAGPNGCGKTTLLRILAGALPPLSGTVELCGKMSGEMTAGERAQLLAFLPAELAVPYDFTVREITVMGRAPRAQWWKDYQAQDYEAAGEMLSSLGLGGVLDKPVNALSSGERRKVFIAQALCQMPQLLLLDEPTAHLDLKCQLDTFALLSALAKKSGAAIIAVSHDIAMLMRFCDRVLLLKNGRQAGLGAPQQAITPQAMLEVYGVQAQLLRDAEGETQLFLKKPL